MIIIHGIGAGPTSVILSDLTTDHYQEKTVSQFLDETQDHMCDKN